VMLFAVAEQSDYLVELSRHVQRRAIELAAAWPPALSHLRLSVNVTSADMARTAFVRTLTGFLAKAEFPAARLTVEITESGVMHDLPAAAATLNRLRALGCRVAIDDFGTGYSSLAWLKELPADYLKIDKGLAGDSIKSAKGEMVVSSIIALARSLGMSVIVEGVETEAHLAQLRDQGCSHYQGYLCSPPIATAELVGLV
jgi:EAL domain-containing protein (putative c-di-GMP-specific phosphodiesterase class I)